MSSRKVIVFGASGEIGGRIARLAVDAGHIVYGVTRGQNLREKVDLSGVRMLTGDKNDPAFLEELGRTLDYDAVIDSVPSLATVENVRKYFPKAENVFFCSSTGTFVPLQYFPADESHPWREKTPVNFYPQCQRDGVALDLYQSSGFPITIFRPTNIIGAGRIPLELWGGRNIEFFRILRDGLPLYVPDCGNVLLQSGYNWDLAKAFVLGLAKPDAVRGQIFIISCKHAVTLEAYLATAMEFLESKSEIIRISPEELMRRKPGISWRWGLEFLLQHMCLDISKVQSVLGYEPTKTTQEGLVDALEWCRRTGLL